jgi:hypothetical protein
MPMETVEDFAHAYLLARRLLLETCPSTVEGYSSQMRAEGTFYDEAEEMLA